MSFRDYRAEVGRMRPTELADTLRQAAQVLDDHAHDCRGTCSEPSYLIESAAALEGAEAVEALGRVEAAVEALCDAECEWSAQTLSDFVDRLRGILAGKGGAL